MKVIWTLPYLQCLYASFATESDDSSSINELFNKFLPIFQAEKPLSDSLCDHYVETLSKLVEIPLSTLPLKASEKLFYTCNTSLLSPSLSGYWKAVNSSYCYQIFSNIYSSVETMLSKLDEENVSVEDIQKFVDYSHLLPRQFFGFHDFKLAKIIEKYIDRLEQEKDNAAQFAIKNRINLLLSALRIRDNYFAYKFRSTCYENSTMFYSAEVEDTSKILLFMLKKLDEGIYHIKYFPIVLKTFSGILSRDESVSREGEDIYSILSVIDPDGKIAEILKEIEQNYWEEVPKLYISSLKKPISLIFLLDLNMKVYMPQSYAFYMERFQKEIDNQGPEYSDALEAIKLLEDNAAGIHSSFENGYEKYVLSKELPKEITFNEVMELNDNQKKILFQSELNFCHRMDASILLQMDSADLKNISSTCLASMKRFCGENALDLHSIVPFLGDESFIYAYHRLHPNTFREMRSGQLRNYAYFDKHKLEEIIPIELLSKDQLMQLSPYMIFYTLENNVSIFKGERPETLYEFLDYESKNHRNGQENVCLYLDILKFFNSLVGPGPDGIMGFENVKNVPVSCWRLMKGVFGTVQSPAIDISSTLPYMDSLLFYSVPSMIDHGTLRALTPELASNFGVDMDNDLRATIDFDLIENDEALNSIPNTLLILALSNFPQIAKRLTEEKIISMISDEDYASTLYIPAERIEMLLSNFCREKLFHILKYDGIKKYLSSLKSDFFAFLSVKEFNEIPLEDAQIILNHMRTDQVLELGGVYQKQDSDAIDLSTYFHLLPYDLFSQLPNGMIHQNTIDHMPPEFSQNFGLSDVGDCLKYDFSKMAQPAIEALDSDCLCRSLQTEEHKASMGVGDLSYLMDKKPIICSSFTYEYVKTRFGMDVLSSLPYSCLDLVDSFWDNISEVGPLLPPEFFQKANIPPKQEYIDCNAHAAANWALEKPDVCKNINEDFPLPYVLRLPVACQAFFFAGNLPKVGFDSINEDVFKEIIKLEIFHGKSWAEILDIPINLRKHVAPNVIGSVQDEENISVQEVNLEEFPNDIFSLIRQPLPQAILKNLDPRFLTYRLCLFHFENELPSGVENIKGCSEKLGFIDRTFKRNHLQFWEKELWSGLKLLLSSSDRPFDDDDIDNIKNLDGKLSKILAESDNKRDFSEYLIELAAIVDTMDEQSRFEMIAFVRLYDFQLIYNLLINSPSHVIPTIQNYPIIKTEEMDTTSFYRLDFTHNANPKNGLIYPQLLYGIISENGEMLASSHSKIWLPSGIDEGALSRIFVDQCLDFIFDGPNNEAYVEELKENNEEGPIYLNPLLTSFLNEKPLFFPFRAERNIGTFIAYTIVKALQSEVVPGIALNEEFYRMLAIAKPEEAEFTEEGNMISEGLTEEERVKLNAYHDCVFSVSSGNAFLLEMLSKLRSDFEWYEGDATFPRPNVFYTPFGPPIGDQSSDKEDYLYQKVLPNELDEYEKEYKEMTYAEFRALMWNFKKVFMQAFYVDRLFNLWNFDLWTEVMGIRHFDLTADQVYYGMRKMNDQNVTHIDSLLRDIKTGDVYGIDFYDAVKMFLDRLNSQQLGGVVAMFTGTPRFAIKADYFYFSFKDLDGEYPVDGDNAFMNDKLMLKRNVLEGIIQDIYEEQIKMFGVDPSECEMVKSPTFPPSHAHGCFGILDVCHGMNNYQLLYVLTQQINAPKNVFIE